MILRVVFDSDYKHQSISVMCHELAVENNVDECKFSVPLSWCLVVVMEIIKTRLSDLKSAHLVLNHLCLVVSIFFLNLNFPAAIS